MIFLALVIGIVAGLRAMMAPTAVAWAAARSHLDLDNSWIAFVSWRYTPWVLTILAIGELITDQLPSTPSRKVPVQFGARLLSGGVSGAAIGYGTDSWPLGLALGLIGAGIGTFGGAAARSRVAAAFGRDAPAAFLEDAVAIVAAVLVYAAL